MKQDSRIPTDKGAKSIGEIMDILNYGSYAANRDYGMTHEQLVSIGIGNEQMRDKYNSENIKPNQNETTR